MVSRIVFIEGCVAAGKSTTLRIIEQRMKNWIIMPEPLERFEAANLVSGGEANYLKKFYDAPDGDSFRKLQTQIILSLLERYERAAEAPQAPVILMERSIQVARKVFLEKNKHLLSDEDLTILSELCKFGERVFEGSSIRIYLRLTEDEMVSRIKQRNRPSEQKLRFSEMREIQRLMDAYAETAADFVIDTSGLTPDEVAEKVITLVSQ